MKLPSSVWSFHLVYEAPIKFVSRMKHHLLYEAPSSVWSFHLVYKASIKCTKLPFKWDIAITSKWYCFPSLFLVIGGWSTWSSWSVCDRSCGGGLKYSNRICSHSETCVDGQTCDGQSVKKKDCNMEICGSKLLLTQQVLRATKERTIYMRAHQFPHCPLLATHICFVYCSITAV